MTKQEEDALRRVIAAVVSRIVARLVWFYILVLAAGYLIGWLWGLWRQS